MDGVMRTGGVVTAIATADATIETDAELVVRMTLVRLGGNVIERGATSFPRLCQAVRVGDHVLLAPGETVALLHVVRVEVIVGAAVGIVVAIEVRALRDRPLASEATKRRRVRILMVVAVVVTARGDRHHRTMASSLVAFVFGMQLDGQRSRMNNNKVRKQQQSMVLI